MTLLHLGIASEFALRSTSVTFFIRLKNGVILKRYGKWRYKNGADNKEIILYNIIKGAMKEDAGNGATRSPVWIINKLCGDLLFLPRTRILVLLWVLSGKEVDSLYLFLFIGARRHTMLAPFNLISAVLFTIMNIFKRCSSPFQGSQAMSPL